MNCPACGHPNQPQARFCNRCGQLLTREPVPPTMPPDSRPICPACGAPVRPQARYCPSCGEALTTEPASTAPPALSPSQVPTQPSKQAAASVPRPGPPPPFAAVLTITPSATEVTVGESLTVALTLTNAGQVPCASLRYQLLGKWEPRLRVVSDPVVEHEPDVSPGQSVTTAFTLKAMQPGKAWLLGNVTLKTRDAPPSLKAVTSAPVLEISVVDA